MSRKTLKPVMYILHVGLDINIHINRILFFMKEIWKVYTEINVE